MIYLDHNATSPLSPAARQAWLAAQDQAWGNPASIHAAGQQARVALDEAKARLAALLGCRAHELVVTSGGTEANALAIHAAALLGAAAGRGGIVASAVEHSSVLRNAELCARRDPRVALRLVAVDGCGRVAPSTLAAALADAPGPPAGLVCLQFANNELGTLQDVAALVAAARAARPGLLIALDCAQGAGKRPIDLRALGVDLASIAGHKFGAPKGSGLLYVRAGLSLEPLLGGGRQQQDRRSGTEDAVAVCALAAALGERLAGWEAEDARQRRLLDGCWRSIAARLPEAVWVAQGAGRLANTLSLAHPGVDRGALVTRLDLAGYAVSPGSACMARRHEPSHVIAALGLDAGLARSVIRVSIGPGTSEEDVQGFAAAYAREVGVGTRP